MHVSKQKLFGVGLHGGWTNWGMEMSIGVSYLAGLRVFISSLSSFPPLPSLLPARSARSEEEEEESPIVRRRPTPRPQSPETLIRPPLPSGITAPAPGEPRRAGEGEGGLSSAGCPNSGRPSPGWVGLGGGGWFSPAPVRRAGRVGRGGCRRHGTRIPPRFARAVEVVKPWRGTSGSCCWPARFAGPFSRFWVRVLFLFCGVSIGGPGGYTVGSLPGNGLLLYKDLSWVGYAIFFPSLLGRLSFLRWLCLSHGDAG
ncbi:hypothetical protein NL676_005665 [Syzygium grande]|nr:hypothetical protein NL676_005665 [Syzygium grande]